MKRVAIAGVAAAAAIAAVIFIFAPTRTPRVEWNVYTPGQTVSLVALIATPERYEGKKVQVIGYVVLEFEGTAVYLHEEDAKHMLTSNGLWIDFGKAERSLVKNGEAQPQYAIIDGVVHGGMRGHMGLWSGSLTNLTRLEFFSKKKEPNQSLQPTALLGRG